jgi:hypothetical protein
MAHINGPAVMSAINAIERGETRPAAETPANGVLPYDFFEWGTGVLIKQLFRLFVSNKDARGALGMQQYAAFCQATEGQGCDGKRWSDHCRSLGVDKPEDGISLGHFGRL